jgi:hypothetical protein
MRRDLRKCLPSPPLGFPGFPGSRGLVADLSEEDVTRTQEHTALRKRVGRGVRVGGGLVSRRDAIRLTRTVSLAA